MSADEHTDSRGPWYGKRPSKNELRAILRDHQNWLAAGAKEKPPHDLRGIDLREAKLSGADLSGANLSGADLSGAILTEANIEGRERT